MTTRTILLAVLMIAGCLPAARSDRMFLPPAASARRTEERLHELQSRFAQGLLTEEEYLRQRDDIRKEAEFERTLEKSVTRPQ